MTVIGINGSPRKGWNTYILVEETLKGAAARGAETELINLYDLSVKGCISCFECKRRGDRAWAVAPFGMICGRYWIR